MEAEKSYPGWTKVEDMEALMGVSMWRPPLYDRVRAAEVLASAAASVGGNSSQSIGVRHREMAAPALLAAPLCLRATRWPVAKAAMLAKQTLAMKFGHAPTYSEYLHYDLSMKFWHAPTIVC
eukprot:1229300-Prymnesium_polylepis.2